MVTFVNSLYKPDLHEPQQKRKKINVAFSPLRLRGGGKEDGDESDDENEGNSFQGEAIWNESQKDITDETMQSTTPKQGDRVKRRSSSCSGRIEGSCERVTIEFKDDMELMIPKMIDMKRLKTQEKRKHRSRRIPCEEIVPYGILLKDLAGTYTKEKEVNYELVVQADIETDAIDTSQDVPQRDDSNMDGNAGETKTKDKEECKTLGSDNLGDSESQDFVGAAEIDNVEDLNVEGGHIADRDEGQHCKDPFEFVSDDSFDDPPYKPPKKKAPLPPNISKRHRPLSSEQSKPSSCRDSLVTADVRQKNGAGPKQQKIDPKVLEFLVHRFAKAKQLDLAKQCLPLSFFNELVSVYGAVPGGGGLAPYTSGKYVMGTKYFALCPHSPHRCS